MSENTQDQPCHTAEPGVGDEPAKADIPTNLPKRLLDMTNVTIVEVQRYYPPGVSEIIAGSAICFIGAVDNTTVLKYPHAPEDREGIETEARLLEVLGSHPRIIGPKGLTEHGLLLQRAVNGSLDEYIESQSSISLIQKLLWCHQITEAISYIHTKRVIHCDLNTHNVLLDENLDILLADFQGVLKSADGETLLDGLSRECTKSSMPRPDTGYASVATDLFALGSTIYEIMTGHEVFPELNGLDDEEEIESRFRNGQFPVEDFPCAAVVEKCWRQQYQSADEALVDIAEIKASYDATE